MKNSERFEKAVNFDAIDRVMTYDFVDNRKVLEQYGGFGGKSEYCFDELVEINARAFRGIGLDITRFVHDPLNHWMGSKIKNWIRFFGVDPDGWEVSQTGGTAWISKRPFETLSELEKNMPQPPEYEQIRQWYLPYISLIKQVFDANDLVFIGAVEGPLSDSYTYTDMELFMLGIHDAPELIFHIMDCTAQFSAYVAKAFSEHASAPLMFMGEDCACGTGPMFDPGFIRQAALPRWKLIMEPIKERGYKFLFHTDGRYGPLLPIIFEEFGADGLNPIERNGCNDIFEIKRQYSSKLLFGNVCCATTLPRGNVYDVEDETLELIETIAPDGGIFIGSSSEVHDLVPVENVAAMYRTVREYGAYPIDCERIGKRRADIAGKLKLRRDPSTV
ncbi:MAG: uroporphyrinogen decarboxylase family protein [Planctomycetota bacterium]